jgi:nucleoside-diphosphate-sugar epimerase
MRVLRDAPPRGVHLLVLTSSAHRAAALYRAGATPLVGNLDSPQTLRRLAGLGQRVLHLAPPPSEGTTDPRTGALVAALRGRAAPAALVYGSTTGVYGDAGGARVAETRTLAPRNARAHRRVHAEDTLWAWGRTGGGPRISVLRIPGIYAPDREGGTPHQRLLRGTPVLQAADDVFTNHIHADDLAQACWLALWRGAPQRAYNVADATQLQMGDYMDLAADLYGLPRPPRISREQAQVAVSPMLLSFMNESRRLVTQRMQRELRVRLRYPDVRSGLLSKK